MQSGGGGSWQGGADPAARMAAAGRVEADPAARMAAVGKVEADTAARTAAAGTVGGDTTVERGAADGTVPRVGVYFGGPGWWGGWPYTFAYPYTYGYPYAYGYGYSYPEYPYSDPAYVQADPPVYAEQSPQVQPGLPAGYWYYCTNPAGYYPYVQSCGKPWMQVTPQTVRSMIRISTIPSARARLSRRETCGRVTPSCSAIAFCVSPSS